MALPKQIQDQIAASERMVNEQAALRGGSAPPAPVSQLAGNGEPLPVTPPADPPSPAFPPAAPASHETPLPPTQGGGNEWEQRYRVLEGKYRAEVPRLSAQLREQAGVNQNLQQQMNQLSQELQRLRTVPEQRSLITAEEAKEFTPEFLDIVGRRATEVASPVISQLSNEVNGLRQQVTEIRQAEAETVKDRVRAQLDSTPGLEDWRTTNNMPEFVQWLSQVDLLSGEVRHGLLTRNFEMGNSAAVIAAFRAFHDEHAASQRPPPGSQQGLPGVQLAEFVAPGRPTAPVQPSSAQGDVQIWTPKLIDEFFAAVRRGQFKNTPELKAAYERDMASAQAEGRFRPS